ncbi:MAG: hypothetical protein BWY89_01167 [Bacteroidetes bacterium ADurb.BinA012]|nr:MAG: hypothetical protein BWY89_01167 [Bacteroidetes bacterium ADurb.BinA012]
MGVCVPRAGRMSVIRSPSFSRSSSVIIPAPECARVMSGGSISIRFLSLKLPRIDSRAALILSLSKPLSGLYSE